MARMTSSTDHTSGFRRWARGKAAYRWAVAGAMVLLALVVFLNGRHSVHFDTRPDFYLEPWRTLTRFYSAWTSTPYLGSPNYHTGAITSVAPLAALSALGLSPSMVFKTWHFVLLALAGWGVIRLVRHQLPDLSRYAGLFGGVVYVANPWAIDGASVLPIALSLALFPWQILWLLKAFENPRDWRWPAFFGFTFFAMAGSNAAVQPLFGLVMVPVVAGYARLALAASWREVAGVVGKCAAFVVVLSAYWLPATFAAGRAGSEHADTTESLAGIFSTSSFAEVLRGLGFWPLYGGDTRGPWLGSHTSYVDNGAVVIATFVGVGLALVSLLAVRTRVRRLLIAMTAVGVVLMVGAYPWSSPSLFGRALRWSFENVPLLILFRTTNKVGEVLVLALALASAAGVAWLFTHVRRRWLTAPLLALVMIGVSFPAWQGNLYVSEWPIPDYWKQAGQYLDTGPADQRTLVVPGYVTATYRWRGSGRPDELLYGLTERNVVVPAAVQNTTPAAFNFMSALDDTFQGATGPAQSLSTFARLLGAQQVLVRHDWDWENYGGIRPSGVDRAVTADSGLKGIRNFGHPGENVQGPGQQPDGFFEKFAPPLQLYGVPSAAGMVRAEALDATTVVAGDGWAVPAMERAGLMSPGAPFRYAQDLSPDDLGPLLGPTHRLVITDTNRRRTVVPGTVTHGNGRLLAAGEPLTGATRTLGTDPSDQTVLDTGAVRATERLAASLPEQLPGSSPANVLDGDASTSWLAGIGNSALDSSLTLRLPERRRLGTVKIAQPLLGGVFIRSVEVRAAGELRRVDLSMGPATVDFGDLRADRITVKVTSLNGIGDNAVGLNEVSIPELQVTPRVKMPTTVVDLYKELAPDDRAQFRQTPMQILMTRVRGPRGDDEANLRREFATATSRDFRARAVVRISPARVGLIDRVAGIRAGATSSSVFFDNPDLRASMAFDGDASTGWLTNEALKGSWIQQRGPRRDLSSITINQKAWTTDGPTNWIKAIDVYVDGTLVRTAAVNRGTTRVRLAAPGKTLSGRILKIVVSADTDPSVATSPMITRIDGGLTSKADPRGRADVCIDVAKVDGTPLAMRRTDPATNQWVACGQPLNLPAGTHVIDPIDNAVVLDSLDLIGSPEAGAPSPAVVPGVRFSSDIGSRVQANVEASPDGRPYVLVLSQAFDDRWRASVDGRSLGKPFLVDGHAMGWTIDAPGPHQVILEFGPQTGTYVGSVITVLGLLAVGPLAVRWRRSDRVVPEPAPQRRRRLPGVLAWLALLAGVYVVASWTGLIAAVLLAGWHWFRAPDPRVLVIAGAVTVAAAGAVVVVYQGHPGDFSYVATGFFPNAMAKVGLILVVVGGWRHRPGGADAG